MLMLPGMALDNVLSLRWVVADTWNVRVSIALRSGTSGNVSEKSSSSAVYIFPCLGVSGRRFTTVVVSVLYSCDFQEVSTAYRSLRGSDPNGLVHISK
jgi:hypothetical protein